MNSSLHLRPHFGLLQPQRQHHPRRKDERQSQAGPQAVDPQPRFEAKYVPTGKPITP